MKTTALLKRVLAAVALAALCTACGEKGLRYDDTPHGLRTIASLKALCTAESMTLREEISIRGTVTANDRYGEFYKTLVIEDETGGIRILADHPALADDYPLGTVATVSCNGLALGDHGGSIRLGAPPAAGGEYSVERIPRGELPRYIRTAPGERLRPARCAFADIDLRHADTYVRFDGIRFATAGPWCDRDPATGECITTERQIVDAAGNLFRVRTAATCSYATEPVPEGTGSVCGVVESFNGVFSLRVVNREIVFPTAGGLPTACP